MKSSPIATRHRTWSGKDYLESLIDPIDGLSETIFSILIFILYILAFRLILLSSTPQGSISQENVNDLLIGAVGAVLAWGLIDGIMYALFAYSS